MVKKSGKPLMEIEFDGIAYRAWLQRETRRAWWRGKAAQKMAKDYCAHCGRLKYCGRLRVNEYIILDVLRGKPCPDYHGAWTIIFWRSRYVS